MDARQRRFIQITTPILLAIALLISACKTTDPPAEQTFTLSVAQAQSTTPVNAERGQELQAQSTTPTSVERGQEIYRASCEVCHGEKGERGAAPLRDTVQQLDDAAIAEFIVKGAPKKGMPALSTLTSEEIADVVAFIRTWSK